MVVVGEALTTVFSVSCLGWRNCIGTTVGLSFEYRAAPRGAPPSLPLFRGSNNSVALRLPAGDRNDEYQNEIIVVVSDGIGEEQKATIYPVAVSRLYTGWLGSVVVRALDL